MTHKVLMVDDNPIDRSIYRSMLEQHVPGLTIEEVGGAREAIRALKQRRYDCAFLDYEMPDGTGLSVLEAIKGAHRTPVVMVTGVDEIDVAVGALRAGAVDYLVKGRLMAEEMVAALQAAVMHGHQLRARQDTMRHLALVQGVLLQSEELTLIVDMSNGMLVEAGTIGLAQLGVRRGEVVGRNVYKLDLFGPEGWDALVTRLARQPAAWTPATPKSVALEARAQKLNVEGKPYVLLQARALAP